MKKQILALILTAVVLTLRPALGMMEENRADGKPKLPILQRQTSPRDDLPVIDNTIIPETEEDKVRQLQSIKQTWLNSKDQFPNLQLQLSQGRILYGVPLKSYDSSVRQPNQNKVVLLEVKGNSVPLKAIFKPRGPLHQKVEQGAFEIAQYLGMEGLIPPTVAHEFEGKQGIVSYYIDVGDIQNPWKTRYEIGQLQELVSPQSLNNFYAFSKAFGMWDLKWFNIILVGSNPPYEIMSLDNESLISTVYAPKGEHFFVCWKLDPDCKSSSYADLADFKPTILEERDIPDSFEDLKRFFIQDKSIQDLSNEEEKKEVILKRIKSFLWGKKSVPHYIGQKGWWLQLYDGFSNIPPPRITSLNAFVVSRFQELDESRLREFFQDSNLDKPLFSNEHYESILLRSRALLEELGFSRE